MLKKVLSLFVVFAFITMALCACQVTTQQNDKDLLSNSQTGSAQDSLAENSNPNTSNTKNDIKGTFLDWKTAYLDFIESRESVYDFDYRYALVYVDNDDIPELYAMGVCEADGDLICSYKNGNVIEQHLGRRLGGKYVERSGIIINQNGHMGKYYDNVYKLDQTGFSLILNASYSERYVTLENNDFEIINEYFIDGKTVSKDEYNNAVNSAIDLSQTTEFYEKSVSYDVIKQQIEDCK